MRSSLPWFVVAMSCALILHGMAGWLCACEPTVATLVSGAGCADPGWKVFGTLAAFMVLHFMPPVLLVASLAVMVSASIRENVPGEPGRLRRDGQSGRAAKAAMAFAFLWVLALAWVRYRVHPSIA